jgi:hypothetical protein
MDVWMALVTAWPTLQQQGAVTSEGFGHYAICPLQQHCLGSALPSGAQLLIVSSANVADIAWRVPWVGAVVDLGRACNVVHGCLQRCK